MSTPPLTTKDAARASTRVRGVTIAAMIVTAVVLALFFLFRLLRADSETVSLAIIGAVILWPVAAILATVAFVKPGQNRTIAVFCGIGLLIPVGALAYGLLTTMGI